MCFPQESPAATLFEGFAGQGSAKRFIHCTCVWSLRQVPNRGAVPSVVLTGRILQVATVLCSRTMAGGDRDRLTVGMTRAAV
jgi:hypothetical protein